MTVANEDVKVDEISALIDAMEEMGINTLSAGLSVSNPSVTQLQNLHYLGLAEDPVTDLYDSYIVHRLISDSIDAALDVPDNAYDSVALDDIKVDEISALIEAMGVMGITTLNSSLSFNDPSRDEIEDLHNLGLGDPVGDVYDSYIVHRLLSSAIDTVLTVPSEAYMVGSTEDIKKAEIDHIIESMDILGVTNVSTIASTITVAKLKTLSSQDIDDLVEPPSGPNVIIYYLISDVVDPSNNIYDAIDPINADDYYVMNGGIRVRLLRTSIATAITALP
jgi:hypothetical protein